MSATDRLRTLKAVEALADWRVRVSWSDGTVAEIDLGDVLDNEAFAPLRDPTEFATVSVGEWGHSLVWPSGVEISSESLWLDTLSATGRGDVRRFLEWRLTHGLSLSRAAEALGLSRRMVAYYSNGEKRIPLTVLLACRGWEVGPLPHSRQAQVVEVVAEVGDGA